MLKIMDRDHFDKVMEFATSVKAEDALKGMLDYLDKYACHDDAERTRCELYSDFAPYSFYFRMYRRNSKGEYGYWFNGGLIYSGPGQPLDGSFPALTVSLASDGCKLHDWSIHT